jgi:autotransporter-associated beta strand protein
MKTTPLHLLRSGALAAALFYAVPAQADDILWVGATNGALNWNTDANWDGGVYPNADTNSADLRKDWASAVINLSAPVTVNGIFSDDTGATGDTALVISNGGTSANTLSLAGTDPSVSVTGGSTLSLGVNLQSSAGFTKTGNGFLLLSGSNSIAGDLVVSGGTLTVAAANAVNSGTTLRIDPGATNRVNGNVTIAGLNDNAGSGGSVGNTSGGGKTLTIAGSGTYRFNGNFNPNTNNRVGLVVSGAATQTLGGDNTANIGYQSVTGNGGTLVFAKQNSIFRGLAAGAVANAGVAGNPGISVSSGGTVALGVGDSASGYFDAAAIATFLDGSHMGTSSDSAGFRNGSILGFDTANATGGTFTYSSALADIGTSTGIGFAKLGAGTLVLGAANTYTGGTTVRAGTLVVDGSTAAGSAVTVASGATLGGSGVIAGATTIQSGGSLAPGNSPGVLSFGSDLTLEGAVVMELNGLTRATQYDGIDVGGQLNYGGTLTLNFGSTFADGDSFNLFDFASTTGTFDSITFAGAYIGALANDSGVWTGNIGGQDFSYLDSTGQLNVVPEPSTYALCALAAVSWGALRLLRRRARPALSRC